MSHQVKRQQDKSDVSSLSSDTDQNCNSSILAENLDIIKLDTWFKQTGRMFPAIEGRASLEMQITAAYTHALINSRFFSPVP